MKRETKLKHYKLMHFKIKNNTAKTKKILQYIF